jgi:hypothetical protein
MNSVLDGDGRRRAYAPISWLYFTGLVTYKKGVQGLLIGRGAALHAAQFTMIRKTRSAPREPFAQRSHGSSTRKNRRHAHHSLLRLDQTR